MRTTRSSQSRFIRTRKREMFREYVSRFAVVLTTSVLVASSTTREVLAQAAPATISVSGDIAAPLTLSASDLAGMPRATVSTTSNGITTEYSGVWMAEILKKAGAPLGAGMRGNSLSTYVIASASDGYQVLFSLGELDPELTDGQYLLADSANGKPLFGETGAFRLVVPKDKRGARSVRLLSSIKVVQLRK